MRAHRRIDGRHHGNADPERALLCGLYLQALKDAEQSRDPVLKLESRQWLFRFGLSRGLCVLIDIEPAAIARRLMELE